MVGQDPVPPLVATGESIMIIADQDKVRKACRGNSHVLSDLIQERKDDIYKLAYAYVKNREDALDILHDVVCKVIISIKNLKNPEFFNAWLIRITINCCLDYLKKNNKISAFEKKYQNSQGIEQIADNCKNYERLAAKIDLFKAVDKLSIEQRKVVILKYYQDLTLHQVAEKMACPVGTVKSRLSKALYYLRRELKERI
jgi:RNA polymerase sigma-70 factor (ECF subfamily)